MAAAVDNKMSGFGFDDDDLLDDELSAIGDDDDDGLESFSGADEGSGADMFSDSEEDDDEFTFDDDDAVTEDLDDVSAPAAETGDSSSKKKTMMMAIGAAVLGLLVVGGIVFTQMSESPSLPDDLAKESESMDSPLPVANEMSDQEPQADFAATTANDGMEMDSQNMPNPAVTDARFFVQVANCVEQQCVQNSQNLLKSLGYNSWVQHQNEPIQMIEVVSQELFGDESSHNLVKDINDKNYLVGEVFRKPVSGRFQLSAGLFPDAQVATHIINYLNTQYAPQLAFTLQPTRMNILHKKVRIGGYTNQKRAETLRTILSRKDQRFKASFVVATNP